MIWCIHLDNAYTAICLNRYCSDVAFEFTYVCRTYTHPISTMLVKNIPSRFQGNISGYSSSHILILLYIIYSIFTHIVYRSTRLIIHTCLYNSHIVAIRRRYFHTVNYSYTSIYYITYVSAVITVTTIIYYSVT